MWNTIPVLSLSISLTYREDSISLRFSLWMDKIRDWMTSTFQESCLNEGQVAQHRGSERRGPARLTGRWHSKWELGAHRETLVSSTHCLWAGPAGWHHTELLVELIGSPAGTIEMVEIVLSVLCWTDREISFGKGTGEIGPQMGKVTNPNVSLPYNSILWVEWQGRRSWTALLGRRRGDQLCWWHRHIHHVSPPGSPGSKNQMGTLGGWCWGVSNGIFHFGFQEVLVPFSQIWTTSMSLLLNVCGLRNLHGLFTNWVEDWLLICFFQWEHPICFYKKVAWHMATQMPIMFTFLSYKANISSFGPRMEKTIVVHSILFLLRF